MSVYEIAQLAMRKKATASTGFILLDIDEDGTDVFIDAMPGPVLLCRIDRDEIGHEAVTHVLDALEIYYVEEGDEE